MHINDNALNFDLYRDSKERILDELVFYQQIFFPRVCFEPLSLR
jgi:hypothetical protein